MKNNCVAGCQKLWKCYEFLPNQCFVNIPKVTRVNVPLTVLIVYHVPLWYKKTNQVSIFCVTHSSCTKNCLNVLEVFQLTLSCSLKYTESWGRGWRGWGWRGSSCSSREKLQGKVCIEGLRHLSCRRCSARTEVGRNVSGLPRLHGVLTEVSMEALL